MIFHIWLEPGVPANDVVVRVSSRMALLDQVPEIPVAETAWLPSVEEKESVMVLLGKFEV